MASFYENKIFQIVLFTLIPFIGGIIVGFTTGGSMYPWYDTINRPSFNPPSWIFGPVWSILYLMMGYASFRVWDEGNGFTGTARYPIILYFVQLIVNLAWSYTFFYFHRIGIATIHIFILWLLIVITAILFYQIDKLAGYLFIPYLLWVSFASVLCFTYWRIN